MKIGIVGSGNMGRTLGLLWSELGHDVLFGARTIAQAKAVAARAPRGARHGTNDDAASFGEVVLWTVRDVHANEVLARPATLEGKIVVDTNNGPIQSGFVLGSPGVPSAAERLAAEVPGARVVKGFNTMAQEIFDLAPAALAEHRVSAFIAGDDAAAKATVAELARGMGLAPLDVGPLAAARMLEGLADFIRYAMGACALGPTATISVTKLPCAESRYGGRTPTRLS